MPRLLVVFADGKKGSMDATRVYTEGGVLYAISSANAFVGFPLSSVHHWSVMVTPSEHGPGFVVEA